MTIYLRDKENRTVVDIELNFTANKQDLHSCVVIENYSMLLLDNLDRSGEVINDFSELSELRGWFWEVYMEMSDSPNFKDAKEQVEAKLSIVAKKYNLHIVTD